VAGRPRVVKDEHWEIYTEELYPDYILPPPRIAQTIVYHPP
jgi:hypothetical protein